MGSTAFLDPKYIGVVQGKKHSGIHCKYMSRFTFLAQLFDTFLIRVVMMICWLKEIISTSFYFKIITAPKNHKMAIVGFEMSFLFE